ncbi:hypothetical protein [Peredibacter starrii]|uniref:Uncharacterized protein n=1 Tax=Peredibacter starrii TaxID=28202 RepID=A0AAX4HMK2_9BACT|nr:hypothetical protein [Peredibacter starrii]WPU64388.1 hypothetical protein SOO65_16975 [Peredibacter starrii]
MINENVEPFRNPSRNNKTIKSGYDAYEDQEDKKNAESERNTGRGSEVHSGKLVHKENDFDRSGVGGSKGSESNHTKERQKQSSAGTKNTDSNLSAHQEDARRQ